MTTTGIRHTTGTPPPVQTDTSQVGDVGSTQTASGVAGASNGATPDPAAPAFGAILESLRNFMPNINSGQFETRLAEITAKLKEVSGEVNTDRVLNEQESKRLNMKENEAKIEESEKKLEDAEAKRKSGGIFDKIAMAFQALGALLMIALGAALAAVPGMQAVGGLMIAAGVIMAISLINSIVQEANDGAGILGSLAKAINPDASDELIAGLDIGLTVTLAVVGIALAIASGRVDGVATGVTALAKAADAIRTVALTASAITNAASATANVGSAGYGMSAAESSGEAAELQADSQEIQALMQQLDDLIDQALAILMGASERFNAMLDSLTEMNKDTGDTLSSTRFAG